MTMQELYMILEGLEQGIKIATDEEERKLYAYLKLLVVKDKALRYTRQSSKLPN